LAIFGVGVVFVGLGALGWVQQISGAEEAERRWTRQGAVMRQAPMEDASVTLTPPGFTEVQVISDNTPPGWLQVRYDGEGAQVQGFIRESMLTPARGEGNDAADRP
jgi:hypothetical protein